MKDYLVGAFVTALLVWVARMVCDIFFVMKVRGSKEYRAGYRDGIQAARLELESTDEEP